MTRILYAIIYLFIAVFELNVAWKISLMLFITTKSFIFCPLFLNTRH